MSPLGIGSCLGAPTDEDDALYENAIRVALAHGITFIDTAINYRCQRSERAIGRVLREPRDNGDGASRPVVCTKGGYVPLDVTPPESKDAYRAYVTREYVDSGIIAPRDLIAGGHCIAPGFLRDQVARSLANLQTESIGLYYLHNPEQQLDGVPRDEFGRRVRAAFTALEQCVTDGQIHAYGCATWHGLRVAPDAANHLSVESLVGAARDVAGESHNFAAVQVPINLGMTEAIRLPSQSVDGHQRTTLEACDELGIAIVAVAPLMQGRLAHDLPAAARVAFPEARTDAACALSFVRMVPRLASIVVGMRSAQHITENVAQFAP